MRRSSAESVSEDQLSHDETPSDSSMEGSIPSEIKGIFSQDLNSGGAFCFEKTYPSAPNPTLRLAGAGHIGLPVNSRDVLAIKEHSRPIKSGPLGTANAEDAWKMKASKVTLDNSAWTIFLRRVVEDVCKALAIEFAHSKPRCDLQQLWLQEKSSTLSLEKEKLPNDAFATLIITLPCPFTGGEVDISHAGISRTIDQARNSLLHTSATAWYHGLAPKFKPITDGHRIALHYHLIHTTTSICPTLSSPSKAIGQLGKVLTRWKTSVFKWGTPRKIVHLLDHKYSEAKLTEDGLEGRDAYAVSILKDIAQNSGFKLLLAHLELSAWGDATCGPVQKWGRKQYCQLSSGSGREEVDGTDPSRLEFKYPLDVDYKLVLLQLRALDGTPLKDRVDLEEMLCPIGRKAMESMPGDLAALKRGKPDCIEYSEGVSTLLTGKLCRSFRRSVLIICPSERYSALIYGKVSSKTALDVLRSSSSANPTAQEMSFVDCVLGSHDEYSNPELQDVLQVVTTCACRWGNFAVWSKAMDACQGWGGIDRIQRKGLLSALLSLPFDSATRSVCCIMKNEEGRSARIQFALAACRELKAAGLSTSWILKALQTDIRTITDLGLSELDVLVRTIAGAGGMQPVENSVLPALTKKSDPGRNVTVVRGLRHELDLKEDCLVPQEERGHAERIINTLLSSTISDWKPFAVEEEERSVGTFTYASMVAHPPSADVAINLVKAAMETKSAALIKTLTQKLMAIPEGGDYFEIDPKDAVRLILLPTLKEITQSLEREPPEASLVKAVQQLKRGLSNVFVGRKDWGLYEFRTIIVPALGGKLDVEYIRDGLVSHFCKSQHDLSLYQELCRQLGIWMNESSDQAFQKAIRQIIKHLLKTASNDPKSQYFRSMSSVEAVLKLCGEFGFTEFSSYIFARVAEQAASLVVQHSPGFVISSLGQFGQWLAGQGHGPLYPNFPELSRVVVAAWREKALGPMPAGVALLASATDQISCACKDCVQVKSYFQFSNPYEGRLDQIGWARINHVVEKTLPHCRGMARWKTISSKSSQSLWMRKSDETIQSLVWLEKKREGLRALERITQDEATLKQVLGEDEYRRVLVALHVDYVNSPLPASPVQGEEVASLTASSSTPTRSASANNERPAKRRKVDSA